MVRPNGLLRFTALLLWLLVIFFVSHQPSASIPDYGPWDLLIKKAGHLLAYGVLALLAKWVGFSTRSSLVLVLAYAASDELHQRYIPGRHGNILDVLIDMLGAVLALLLAHYLSFRWRKFQWARTAGSGERLPRDA